MKKLIFLNFLATALIAFVFSSCSETPVPMAEIYGTIEGYKVSFTPIAINVTNYSWNFGDGTAISTEAEPVHTYETSGEYVVTLKVTGEGGEATTTRTMVIQATSIIDLLTGGKNAANGKTWVLSKAFAPGKDGAGPVTNTMPVTTPSVENVLEMFGIGAEYDNEYTFLYDGKYRVNLKNNNALAGAVYGIATQTVVGNPAYEVGLCAAAYNFPANATFTIHTEDFTIAAITDPNTTAVPPVYSNVKFTGKNWIKFSEGAYFGILDFQQQSGFVIKEITADKMNVALFLCGYGYGEDMNMILMPTNLIHLTFVKK